MQSCWWQKNTKSGDDILHLNTETLRIPIQPDDIYIKPILEKIFSRNSVNKDKKWKNDSMLDNVAHLEKKRAEKKLWFVIIKRGQDRRIIVIPEQVYEQFFLDCYDLIRFVFTELVPDIGSKQITYYSISEGRVKDKTLPKERLYDVVRFAIGKGTNIPNILGKSKPDLRNYPILAGQEIPGSGLDVWDIHLNKLEEQDSA